MSSAGRAGSKRIGFEVAVGPRRLTINQANAFLTTEPDGQINWPSHHGLYFFDTRLISSWALYANGTSWQLLNSAAVDFFACRIFLANRRFPTEHGDIAERTLGLSVSRSLEGGLHEDFDITNHNQNAICFNLEIAMRCDFADLFEVKSGHIVRRGRIETTWSQSESKLSTEYTNQDFKRKVILRAGRSDSDPVYANGRLSFEVRLEPKASWHSCLMYELVAGDVIAKPPRACASNFAETEVAKRVENWRSNVLKLRTDNEQFQALYDQAIADMACLRYPVSGETHTEFLPAAGVPWFVAMFGRDSLIASLQNALVHPDFARATLKALAGFQATETDDYRDAEPGKIMHELRLGELAHFHLVPHTPYYGTADATMLYLIVLHNAWRCTGARDLVEQHLSTAERCLEWIDKYGDRDGDGFQEYQTRSSAGYENQGWKDAGEAVVYPDGSLVKGPKALCELQGYVYDAWLRMAEIYDMLGNPRRAGALRDKAADLFRRFNETFWDEASGFYAYALDGEKTKVLSVASNPGQCLWSGIVPRDRAEKVVRRLMQADMWSGWGIRTLSMRNPSFNPHSYQNGSVWPHDNGIIAMGFRRYGFAEEAIQIADDVSHAGSYFALHRVPELYAGTARGPNNFPVQYLGANVPQAWAAGSNFHFLQTILGLVPDAPNGKLYVDPKLPEWLPRLELVDLRIGKQVFHLQFSRRGERTEWDVLHGPADAVVSRSFTTGNALA
ncbi:MAG TPA: glycogen debranching N-terminal domain-containing protein [Rhizomicrobium sp.]|jgi:glycogen debranching enzyme|nr:glycogen debranching N-terminal domain-containing protein [Rhizomicrobium sp.]